MKRILFYLVLIGIVSFAGPAWADLQSGLRDATDYLINILGAAVFIIGLVWAGISIASGSIQGRDKAIWVIIGGVIIFSSRSIVDLIQRWFR